MHQSMRAKSANRLGQNAPIYITDNNTDNNIDNINIYINNPSILPSTEGGEIDDGQMDGFLEQMRKQGGYYAYLSHGNNRKAEKIDNIAVILADFLKMAKDYPKKICKINQVEVAMNDVADRISMLTESHFEHLVMILNNNPNKIHNIRAFLLTAAYNSITNLEAFYEAEVSYDMRRSVNV